MFTTNEKEGIINMRGNYKYFQPNKLDLKDEYGDGKYLRKCIPR